MEKDNKMEKRGLTYLCDGKECELAGYCSDCIDTTTFADIGKGILTFTKGNFAGNCMLTSDNVVENLKTRKISYYLSFESETLYEKYLSFLKWVIETKGDITEYELAKNIMELSKEWVDLTECEV